MESALPTRRYTLAEYLELDKNAAQRYEYFNGEVVAMGGASLNHNRITRNIIRSLEMPGYGRDRHRLGSCGLKPLHQLKKYFRLFVWQQPRSCFA